MSPSIIYDILVIGGGPAGLSAALGASRQMRRILIVDSQEYRNLATTHMHNVVGFDHVAPLEFREKVLRDLKGRYGEDMVRLVKGRVVSVENQSKEEEKTSFKVKSKGGEEWSARKIIVATGAKDVFPDIPGYAEAWGNFHCLFCHGYEERNTPLSGSLAYGLIPLVATHHLGPNIAMASRLSQKHVIYTNGSPPDQVDQIKANKVIRALLQSGRVTLDERKIKRIVMRGIASDDDTKPNDNDANLVLEYANLVLEFSHGPAAHLAFLAHPTHQTLSPGSAMIVKDLGLELTSSGNEIKAISPMQDTSVRGVYVAGDVSTMMKAASIAISLGSAAGAMVARELAVEDALFP